MSSVFDNDLNLAASLVASQFQGDIGNLKAAETEIPTSDHAHNGNDDIYPLSRENMNFQLLGGSNDITFITGHDDYATYVDGGSQKIYDNGSGTSLIFAGQTAGAQAQVFNADHDSRFQLYLHDFTNQSITSDGHGGTLIGGQIDLINASIPASKIHFVNDPTWMAAPATGEYPLPGPATYG
jgi:hypothetical protein